MVVFAECFEDTVAAVAAHAPAWDLFVNSNAATTTFGATTSVSLGVVGANKRRAFFGFPVHGRYKTDDIALAFGAPSGGTLKIVMFPVVQQLDLFASGATTSHTNIVQSGSPTAWAVAATGTTGPDTPTGHNAGTSRAVFTVPASGATHVFSDETGGGRINPEVDGSYLDVIEEARRAAIKAGVANYVIGVASENEGAAVAAVLQLIGGTTAPSMSGTAYDKVYDGALLENKERVVLSAKTGTKIALQLGGLGFPAGATVRLQYGDLAGTPSETDPYTFVGDEAAGKPIPLSLPYVGSEKYPSIAYRVKFTIAGVNYIGANKLARLLVGPTVDCKHVVISDGHWHTLNYNARTGIVTNGINDGVEALQVQAAGIARIRSKVLLDPTFLYMKSLGDDMDFGQFTIADMFPNLKDGSGLPDPAADSIYITSLADAMELIRSWLLGHCRLPFDMVMLILAAIGNHAPHMWWFRNENNGDLSDAAVHILQALLAYGLIPGEDDTANYPQPEGDEGLAQFSFECGALLELCNNVGYHSAYSGELPEEYPLPISANDPSDWKLSDEWRDWCIAQIAGRTAGCRVSWNAHSCMGLFNAVLPDSYDRNDPNWWLRGWFGANMVQYLPDDSVCHFGHDHCDNRSRNGPRGITGFWYATLANAASLATGGPYSPGFMVSFGVVEAFLHARANGGNTDRYDNAGTYVITVTRDSFTNEYFSTRIHTSPTDVFAYAGYGGGDNGQLKDFADGQLVRSYTIPERKVFRPVDARPVAKGSGSRPFGARPGARPV